MGSINPPTPTPPLPTTTPTTPTTPTILSALPSHCSSSDPVDPVDPVDSLDAAGVEGDASRLPVDRVGSPAPAGGQSGPTTVTPLEECHHPRRDGVEDAPHADETTRVQQQEGDDAEQVRVKAEMDMYIQVGERQEMGAQQHQQHQQQHQQHLQHEEGEGEGEEEEEEEDEIKEEKGDEEMKRKPDRTQ